MMAELFGRVDGYCKGRGGSMHIADFAAGMLGTDFNRPQELRIGLRTFRTPGVACGCDRKIPVSEKGEK